MADDVVELDPASLTRREVALEALSEQIEAVALCDVAQARKFVKFNARAKTFVLLDPRNERKVALNEVLAQLPGHMDALLAVLEKALDAQPKVMPEGAVELARCFEALFNICAVASVRQLQPLIEVSFLDAGFLDAVLDRVARGLRLQMALQGQTESTVDAPVVYDVVSSHFTTIRLLAKLMRYGRTSRADDPGHSLFVRLFANHPQANDIIELTFQSLQIMTDALLSVFYRYSGQINAWLICVLDFLREFAMRPVTLTMLCNHERFTSGRIWHQLISILNSQCVHPQTVDIIYSLVSEMISQEEPYVIDLLLPQQDLVSVFLHFPVTTVSREIDEWSFGQQGLLALKLLETFANDSNFKVLVIAKFALPLLQFLSLDPAEIRRLIQSNQTFVVLILRIVGNLHCYNEGASRPSDLDRLVWEIYTVIEGSTGNAMTPASVRALLVNLYTLVNSPVLREAPHVSPEDCKLLVEFSTKLVYLLAAVGLVGVEG